MFILNALACLTFGVGLKEEVLQPVDDGVDGEDGLPVLAEDV